MAKKPRVRLERLSPLLRASAGRERLIVTGVLIAVNVYGFEAMFSDSGPMEPAWLRMVAIVMLYVLGGAVVGVLLPKKWYVAALACVSPAMLGAFALSMRWRVGEPPPYWTFIVFALSGPLAISLASGYFGSRLRRSKGLGFPPLPRV